MRENMNAQNVIKYLNILNPAGLGLKFRILPENKKLLDEIYELAKQIEPFDKYRNGSDRKLWLWTDRGSYEEFVDTYKADFTYTTVERFIINHEAGVTDYEEMEKQWPVYFPEELVWFKLYLAEHEGCRGLFLNERLIVDTSQNLGKSMDAEPLLQWILEAERKCIDMIKDGTYSEFIAANLPYKHRSGVTKLSTYWKHVPKDKERLFGKIDPKELGEFIEWDESQDEGWPDMTANDYFEICECLYDVLEIKKKYPVHTNETPDEPLTAKECYMAYSANYDSAYPLLEIDEDSAEEFEEFIEHGRTEHHTWEVCLDPNIHLYPTKVDDKYYVIMTMEREEYATFVHVVLELRKKGVPVMKPDYIEKKMTGEEWVAIAPWGDNYNWKYQEKLGIRTLEKRLLPRGNCDELINKIQWFPTDGWSLNKE